MAAEENATYVEYETFSAATITDQNINEFATHSYTLIEQLVPSKERTRICQRALELVENAAPGPGPGSFERCGDFHMEYLLESLTPTIGQVAQHVLFPTYSFFRIYTTGDGLARHVDRPSCEFSVSVNLGYNAPTPWPLWVEGPLGPRSVALEPGDAVVYRGLECPHWRDPFDGEFAVQLFLHYVDQDGPYAEWKFDKNRRLSTMPTAIRLAKHLHLESAGILELGPSRSVPLNPVWILVLEKLQSNCAVNEIVNDTMAKFHLSQVRAEAQIQSIFFWLEKNRLVYID